MVDQKKQFIIKAKGILCSGIRSQELCFLRVKDGIIQAISADMPDASGYEIIDLSDLTLSPCFCDYHLHFSEQAKTTAESLAAVLIRYGIGRAYEGGDKGLAGLSVKETLKGIPGIMTSGYALYKRGGYGSAIGRGVDSLTDAVAVIDELVSCHVDYIKIINSGVYEPESGLISTGGFEATELKRIVDHASSRGLEVYCHANGEKAVREAVAAGVSAIIHGLYGHDETFAEMAERAFSLSQRPMLQGRTSRKRLMLICLLSARHLHIRFGCFREATQVQSSYRTAVLMKRNSDCFSVQVSLLKM
jgi:imidazolonepropionase-like amidohydrolase